MELDSAPTKPIRPTKPTLSDQAQNAANNVLLTQTYQTDMTAYQFDQIRYQEHQTRMKKVRGHILNTVYVGHKPIIRDISDVKEIVKKLQGKLGPKEGREKSLLTKRERELTQPKRGMKPKELVKKWRDLRMDMNLTNFTAIPSEQLTRDFIDSTEGVLPKFHDTWSTRIIDLDSGMSDSLLKKVLDIDDIMDSFDRWVEDYAKSERPSQRDIAMATLDGKTDQPRKNDQQSVNQRS
ncbi:hypothetical protein EYB25_009409 [Talaromyces marneffei]|uniref:uncharacterized protein n=1 Tax=Talaromyces marneffei TaxID=37727 RepID=UPI0012A99426|nr:uncharacterized protein EYB26_008671 [Talaromyces marneffei]KAE8547616.1 hypothetical protein EYB25_009409 [Talaromyces marneffei]QGA20961.1 hypothetical protein EYB26_008671 [Talaromyces marneffei]